MIYSGGKPRETVFSLKVEYERKRLTRMTPRFFIQVPKWLLVLFTEMGRLGGAQTGE